MVEILYKLLAFIAAIGILVAVHEFGHFWVARKLGVKVLRFSIGFGRPLWTKHGKDGVEYVLAAIPLGGYVKMLDEHEGPVPASEVHQAFNRQSLKVRSAVVAAGPMFNFLFAILAYWAVFVAGEPGLRAQLGEVRAASVAAEAGLREGDRILAVNGAAIPSWGEFAFQLAAASVDAGEVRLRVRQPLASERTVRFPAGAIGDLAERKDFLADLGLTVARPVIPPVLGKVMPGGAGERAGLRSGDRVLSADGIQMPTWKAWREYVIARPGQPIRLELRRAGKRLFVTATPEPTTSDGKEIGLLKVGGREPSAAELDEYLVVVRKSPVEAIGAAVAQTWDLSMLTLKVIGRILTGQMSVRNLSGPVTIADAAGKSAQLGWVYFLKLLAIVSISLGVINLLPVPVLDGGHLLMFVVEAVKGSPLSESAQLVGQKVGLAVLMCLMATALYVDLTRYLGG